MGNASALAGLLLLFSAASPASAQPATADGAYAKLSAGNAKIARALFEAQVTNTTPPAAGAPAAAAPKALTVDQIAAMKQNQGWGQVFSAMKAQGLLLDKSLGQVVARYQHRSSGSTGTTVSSRIDAAPKSGPAAAPSASYDAGK
jgi:hypothetical protein